MKIILRWLYIGQACLLLIAGCTVTLAPAYNQTIVDELGTSAKAGFTLLATVSGGSSSDDYPKRADQYNTLLGAIDVLKIQVQARPMPDNKTIQKANAALAAKGVSTDLKTAPSVIALDNIFKNLLQMRNTDKKQGLTAFEVEAFKGNLVLYFDQALTYESFLKR